MVLSGGFIQFIIIYARTPPVTILVGIIHYFHFL